MRQLVFYGPGDFRIEEAPIPAAGKGQIRVRVQSCGICGSDVHGFIGKNKRREPLMVMGHEVAGFVTEIGEGVSGLAIGDQVTINPVVGCGVCQYCRRGEPNLCLERRLYGCVPNSLRSADGLPGGFADEIVVLADNAIPVVGPAPFEWAALAEPLAVGAHAARVAEREAEGGIGSGASVLIIGCGPIGLSAALAVRRRRPRRLLVSEPIDHRRSLASAWEMETHDPGSGIGFASEFDTVIDCVGYSATMSMALNAVKPHGVVVMVGFSEPEIAIPALPIEIGERRISGSSTYTQEDYCDVATWVGSGETDFAPMIQERVGWEGIVDAFRRYGDGSLTAMKTLFQPEASS
jgi:threonine dehydrogenase-like Zn-dependent dehydrogenase